MKQWFKIKEKDEFIAIGSTCAVFLAFCIKKAKNNDETNKPRDQTTRTKRTHVTRPESKQYTPRDKLIKGLGVSLAKTPFDQTTQKEGTLSQIFSYECCVFVFLWRCVSMASSQAIYSAVVCVCFSCAYYYLNI